MADELYLIKGETLSGIGDAIRYLTGMTGYIPVADFEQYIINYANRKCVVNFFNGDNTVLYTSQLSVGEKVEYNYITPTKNNYLFQKWDILPDYITSDINIYPIFVNNDSIKNNFQYGSNNIVESCKSSPGDNLVLPTISDTNMAIYNIYGGFMGSSQSYGVDITSITIHEYITWIGSGAFTACTNLEHVYYTGTTAQWNNIEMYSGTKAIFSNAIIHTKDGVITPS